MKLTEFIKRYDELVERAIEIAEVSRLGTPDDQNAYLSLVALDANTVKLVWNAVEQGYYGDGGSLICECSSAFSVHLLFLPDDEFDAWATSTKEARAAKEKAEREQRDAQAEKARVANELATFARLKAKYGG